MEKAKVFRPRRPTSWQGKEGWRTCQARLANLQEGHQTKGGDDVLASEAKSKKNFMPRGQRKPRKEPAHWTGSYNDCNNQDGYYDTFEVQADPYHPYPSVFDRAPASSETVDAVPIFKPLSSLQACRSLPFRVKQRVEWLRLAATLQGVLLPPIELDR
eukprot:688853-Amphidinium_carterae.1